jgi:hypothetical protein
MVKKLLMDMGRRWYNRVSPWQLDFYTNTIRINIRENFRKDRQLGSFESIAHQMDQLNRILSLIGGALRAPESLHGSPKTDATYGGFRLSHLSATNQNVVPRKL